MFIRKLAFSNFAVRKARVALTVAAVALSVSLVVAVTSGYASLFEAAFKFLNQYMGATDARIVRQNDPIGVPWSVVRELRADPNVRRADGRLSIPLFIPDPAEAPDAHKHVSVIGIDRPDDTRVDRMPLESGKWFDTSTGDVAVVDQAVARILKIKVGDTFTLPYSTKSLSLKLVGIAHKPAVLAVHMRTIYLPLHTLQNLIGAQGRVSVAMIDLTSEADPKAFEQRWRDKLAGEKGLQIHLASDIRKQMDTNLQGIRLLSYLGGAVSMLSATFIIFSALSMGVSERQRSLAMLRAVGAFKKQIAGLVILEGLILAGAGLLIGAPLGYAWMVFLSLLFPNIFVAGAVISWGGVILGAGGTMLAALAASLLPAWSATRVSPLEAMAPLSEPSSKSPPLGFALAGLALIAIDPFIFFGPIARITAMLGSSNPEHAARDWKLYLHFGLGLPGLFVGYFLLSPLFVWVTERVAGPLVARAFGLRYAMLRQQLTTGIWRAAGTSAALMVGLAVLIVLQVTGYTLLGGWKLPDKFPDVFIYTSGMNAAEQKTLAATPGITELMPITIASPEFGSSVFGIGMAAIVPNSTMFIGVDPNKAFRMMELDFHAGNPADAARLLNEGGWLVVTEEYRQLTHCKIGDPLKLGNHTFRIAGVVWSPGIDVMVGMFDMESQFSQRTISSVFGSIEDGKKYFGADRAYLFAADLDMGLQREDLYKNIKHRLNAEGLLVGDVREIKFKIETGFYQLLHMLSTVAFAAMAVASLGVMNTIMAGVRSRRWQFGILRSIGVTRSQLLRLVLAEALLLGLIGCALGLACGFELSADANAASGTIIGYKPPVVIPWAFVWIGIGSVLFIALGASLWPARQVATTEPLALLQAGRSST